MLLNYFKTAFRNFYRHLTYTSINLLGLSVGLATSILIYLWIADELSYDKHYPNAARIFSVIFNAQYTEGKIESGTYTPGPLAEALVHDIPEVEVAARSDWGSERLLRSENKSLLQKG